jgi:phosphoglycerate kinase
VITNLLGKVDTILIGGGMAYTFFKAMGKEIGKSLLEVDKVDLAHDILSRASQGKTRLILPADSRAALELKSGVSTEVVSSDAIPADMVAGDIGPDTERIYREAILSAKTVVWNGPMGVFEIEEFGSGTRAVAEALVEATKKGAVTVVGGGDSAAAMSKYGLEKMVSHVSTGGGASLEFLEGRILPGVAALNDD